MKPTGPMTLDQLAHRCAEALAVGYQGPANGQVSAIPSRRTIRYYSTLGILDRPLEMRGRTAIYGPRHLLQLVAIKRLQEKGLSLVEVQERLAGRTDAQLRALVGIDLPASASAAVPPRSEEFWRSAPPAPEPAAVYVPVAGASPSASPIDCEGAPGATLDVAARTVHEVPLGMGVTLTLPACQPLLDADLAAIRAAARGLLETLRERQLTEGDRR